MAWQDTYFVKIDGVSYKAALVNLARKRSKKGPLSIADAKALWESAMDGKGVTATERRTLQHITRAFAVRPDAEAFLRGKLGEDVAAGPAASGCGGGSAGAVAELSPAASEAGGLARWLPAAVAGAWRRAFWRRPPSAAGVLRMAARLARDGRLRLQDVQALVKSTIGDLGMTTAARRTLERIAADFALDEAALELLGHELSLLGSPPAAAHHPLGGEGPKPKKKRKGAFTAVFFNPGNDPIEPLLEVIASASRSLDVALFMLTDDRLADALIGQHKAGVKVRMLADNDAEHAFDTSDLEKLRKAGIEVRLDRSKLHMHHKFAVADGEVCVNGSLNWTTGALRNNRENIVISRSAEISAAFAEEFQRLWEAFGPRRRGEPGPAPNGRWHGDQIVLFFPDKDDVNFRTLVAEVSSAKKTLDVAVFTLTVPELKDALKDAKSRGVRVRVITDDRQGKFVHGGKHPKELRAAGVEVRMDGAGGNMHHKFCVIDGTTVCNGSFNWTRQAEDGNNENLIIYRNEPGLAHSFAEEFERLWAEFGQK